MTTQQRPAREYDIRFGNGLASGRDVDSIVRREPVVGPRFDQCWAWLQGV